MTELTSTAGRTVVDGVDLDAVVAAARGCAGVDELASGPWNVVTYLPGRQVPGVRITSDHVVISLRGKWGVPAAQIAREVRAAVADLVTPRRVDLVLAEVGDPSPEPGARARQEGIQPEARIAGRRARGRPAAAPARPA
jgi:hypothetical protein